MYLTFRQIVENDSSGLDLELERKQEISGDHLQMCKFASKGQTFLEYRTFVRAEIRRHVNRASRGPAPEQQRQSPFH